jgi:hypothetical protein
MRLKLYMPWSDSIHGVTHVRELVALLEYLHTVKVYQDFPYSLPRLTLLCKKILTFCFCSPIQQAQRYAKLLASSKKVSYQTINVALFLPMSQVGNSKWTPPVTPPKTRASASVTERQEQRLWTKFGSKRGIGAVHGQMDWLPSGTTPDEFLRNAFFSVVFCVGVLLP